MDPRDPHNLYYSLTITITITRSRYPRHLAYLEYSVLTS